MKARCSFRYVLLIPLLVAGMGGAIIFSGTAWSDSPNYINCSSPINNDEVVICSDEKLLALHRQLDDAYNQILWSTMGSSMDVFILQEKWLERRKEECAETVATGTETHRDCIIRTTGSRIEALEAEAVPLRLARTEADELLASVPTERQKCKEEAQSLRDTGVTSKMREGSQVENTCLEKLLSRLTESFFHEDAFGQQGIQVLLGKLSHNIRTLYWGIYNDPKACVGRCGTIWNLMPGHEYTLFLEHALDITVKRVKEVE